MQHIIEPAKEAYIKDLDPRYPGQGDLAPQEMPLKTIAAEIEEKALVSQPKYGRAADEDILKRPRSTSASQPTELYAQMTPPVTNVNLQPSLGPQR